MATGTLVTGPPDFIGVGAQRSGTTWWFDALIEHPAIRAPRDGTKELHFFDGFGARPMADTDVAAYHDLFPREAGQLAGEWTPRYMVDAWTPRLLHRVAPQARILVMLRDPIERFRSGVLHRLRRASPDRREVIAVDAIERGRYAWQLRALRRHFGADRMLVLQYERCRREPEEQYLRTLRFLGLDGGELPDLSQTRGRPEPEKAELWPDLVDALRAALAPDVAALGELVPELDLGLWPNFGRAA